MQKHTYTATQQEQQNRKSSPAQYQTMDGEKGADSVQAITDCRGCSFELTSHVLFASHRTGKSSTDRMWATGEANGKPLQHSCPENPMNSMKRQKDRTLKDELPRSVGAQYATGDQWRNNSRKNEGMEPKQKQYPVVSGTGDGSRVRCCKEQYCIGTWNVRSMTQGKLEVIKQELARGNADILGIS